MNKYETIIAKAELPVNLIELKMELDMVITRIGHLLRVDSKDSFLADLSPTTTLILSETLFKTTDHINKLTERIRK